MPCQMVNTNNKYYKDKNRAKSLGVGMVREGLREDVGLKRGLKDYSVQWSANFSCERIDSKHFQLFGSYNMCHSYSILSL